MVFIKSLILLLSVSARAGAFTVGGKPGYLQNAAQKPLLKSASFGRRPTLMNENKWGTCISQSILQMSLSTSEDDDSTWYSNVSVPYAAALAVFVGFAAFLGPGEFGSESDNAMIQAYIDNPMSPGLNPIFNAIFNLLGAAPLVLSSLVYPQASSKGLSPVPFLAASAAMGYGGLGASFVLLQSHSKLFEFSHSQFPFLQHSQVRT